MLKELINKTKELKEIPFTSKIFKSIFSYIGEPIIINSNKILLKEHVNKVIINSSNSNVTYTIPNNEKFEILDYIDFEKVSLGSVIIKASSNISLNGVSGGSVEIIHAINATGGLRIRKIKNNEFVAIGSFV